MRFACAAPIIIRNLALYAPLLTAAILYPFFSTGTVYALLPFTQEDLDMVNRGQDYRDPEIIRTPSRCSSAGSATNNRVFYIGDSLTVGMAVNGDLLRKTQAAGFGVSIEYSFVESLDGSSSGRRVRAFGASIEATNGYNVSRSIEALNTHSTDFDEQRAGIIVIGLGTNPESNPVDSFTEMMEYIRSINPTANVYWVNTYFQPDEDRYETVNAALEEVRTARGDFDIIDFASVAQNNDDYRLTSDGYHHTAVGYGNKADFIIENISGGGTTEDPSSCARASTGDNERDAFDYLSAIFNPEIAAGMIANFRHESGVNPLKMECLFSLNYGVERYGLDPSWLESDGGVRLANFDRVAQTMLDTGRCPSESRPKSRIEQLGWGIVQWTPASKMIDPSRAAGIPDSQIEDIFYQLEFLVSQLNGEGIGAASSERAAGTALRATTTAEEAAAVFAIRYERCGACREGSEEVRARGVEAIEILARYGSQ